LPKLFKIGQYVIFFWSNENDEPVHVHISKGKYSPNTAKVWLTKGRGSLVANKGRIPQKDLGKLLTVIEDNFDIICNKWKTYFDVDEIKFYC
jgi:hypothetical protein